MRRLVLIWTCHYANFVALKKQVIRREEVANGVENLADKMVVQLQNKFRPVNGGDMVMINIPEVNRGRLAHRTV